MTKNRSKNFAEKVTVKKEPGFSLVKTIIYEIKNVHTDISTFDYEYSFAKFVRDSIWDPNIHLYSIRDSNAIITEIPNRKIIGIEYKKDPLQPQIIESAKSTQQRHSQNYLNIARHLNNKTYEEQYLFAWDLKQP